ncbi:D-alanine--D-alanine ligase [Candidatus Daviesbacteria bacterium]|nr:D-alanine--D-alanine ligase [Candidatus Daviesbacteria bacterium]
MGKLRIGLFFGGRSTEHEVSIITALQAYENLDLSKYEVIPVYVSKNEEFYTNPKFLSFKNYRDLNSFLLSSTKVIVGSRDGAGGLWTSGILPKFIPFDVAFPAFHGSFGEDGSIQGVFEIYQIPYVGFNVLGSSIGMDKIAQKAMFKEWNLAVGKYTWLKRIDFIKDPKRCLKEIQNVVKFPLFVKPANIGSTIGVNKAKNLEELEFNIEVASAYSDKILIEEAIVGENIIEINCAALGYLNVQISVCEMPIRTGDALTFDDKYKRGGKGSKGGSKSAGMASLDRIIPAPIPDKLTKEIQDATFRIFSGMDGCGVARIDYFVDKKTNKFWVNEINTIPGSLSFYLYEPLGIKYQNLLDIVIQAALERYDDQKKTKFSFDSDLLSLMAQKS